MRQEKVRDKAGKAKIRKGSKDQKESLHYLETPGIEPYVNRIICDDSLDVLAGMPSASVDLVITSPPYNFGHAYAQDPHDDTREWNEYFATLNCIWTECARVLRPGGRLAVNVQPLFSDYVPTHHIISNQSGKARPALEGGVSLGEEQLQRQVHLVGELEIAVHALHQVHMGVCRGL